MMQYQDLTNIKLVAILNATSIIFHTGSKLTYVTFQDSLKHELLFFTNSSCQVHDIPVFFLGFIILLFENLLPENTWIIFKQIEGEFKKTQGNGPVACEEMFHFQHYSSLQPQEQNTFSQYKLKE